MVPDFLWPVKQGDLTGYKVTSVIISHTFCSAYSPWLITSFNFRNVRHKSYDHYINENLFQRGCYCNFVQLWLV